MKKTNLKIVEKTENVELKAALEVAKGIEESGDIGRYYYKELERDDIKTDEKIIGLVYDAQSKLSLVLLAFNNEDQTDLNYYQFEAIKREVKEIWVLLEAASKLHSKTH